MSIFFFQAEDGIRDYKVTGVQTCALPISFLRIMFVGSIGMLLFFMVSGALRAAGDARTPLRLGILLTGLNIVCNVALITGVGPLPRLGTAGAAVGTAGAGLPGFRLPRDPPVPR